MKTFKDTATGQYWQFDDHDDVRLVDGAYHAFDVNGDRLARVPETLVQSELPEPAEPTLGELKATKVEAATAKRWEIETGGIVLPNGVAVKTGVDDQNRITSVIANARLAGVESVDFKADTGWVALSIAELESIAAAIARHVQGCFSSERLHHEAIGLLDDPAEVGAYDVSDGWPAVDLRPAELNDPSEAA